LLSGLTATTCWTLSTKQEPSLPTIVIGSDNYPPFNYSGTDGRPTGIDVELATEAFHRMGYQAEFVTIDSDTTDYNRLQ